MLLPLIIIRFRSKRWFHILFFLCFLYTYPKPVVAQTNLSFKVLTLTGKKQGSKDLPEDRGISGVWQRLLKLRTTASVLHTQAHPDDEHAELLTFLSRGQGVRIGLLSLNRGESGGNVLGSEFFDPLGLLRTEEFLLASSYYGLDDLYFTKLVDYGFSKRVEEAYQKWDKQTILNEMVRVIRINRPLVIVSRFHGSPRDGHGNHQAAGELTQEAYQLAGDPNAFPEQITKEGLRPWKPLKLYRGGVRSNEPHHIALNTGIYSSWLGQSYKNFSLLGYSMHRSQHGGHRAEVSGSSLQYYERLNSSVNKAGMESSFLEGIDTTLAGIFKVTKEAAPAGAEALLQTAMKSVDSAIAAFDPTNTAAVVPSLVNGLRSIRSAMRSINDQKESLFMLQIKERQFVDAIHTALALHLKAIAVPHNVKEKPSFFEPQPTMSFAVGQQPFNVEVVLANNSRIPVQPTSLELVAEAPCKIDGEPQELIPLAPNQKLERTYTVTFNGEESYKTSYFSRQSLQENSYQLLERRFENLPWSKPVLCIKATYIINNELLELEVPVETRQANLPYGYDQYTLKLAPAIAVNVQPKLGVILKDSREKTFVATVELVNNYDSTIEGNLSLKLPLGWKASPQQHSFAFTKPGEKNNYSFRITAPAIEEKEYLLEAVAMANGKLYSEGYQLIRYRDLDLTMQYSDATIKIKGINAKVASNIRIAYIMGVGDEVPTSLQQLGARVHLLTTNDLASGKLEDYDAIMVGTRAYAVRQDLAMYNQRLLAYAKAGGHLIILFQTPEFVPQQMAPFPAQLPANPEEVSEEDSPVKLLAPHHRVMNYPNKITLKDFDHWVEQRGSKFFSTWDTAYTPIISTQDAGQAPQSGGWLMASYGKGFYTYCAYSFHRQLSYGVEGAYRIMANLISYGKK